MRRVITLILAAALCSVPVRAAAASPEEPVLQWQYVVRCVFFHDGEPVHYGGLVVMDGAVGAYCQNSLRAREARVYAKKHTLDLDGLVVAFANQPWSEPSALDKALGEETLRRAYGLSSHSILGNLDIALYYPEADWAEIRVRRLSLRDPHGFCISEYREHFDQQIESALEDCGRLGFSLPHS